MPDPKHRNSPVLAFLQNNAVVTCYGVSTAIVALLFVGVYFKCVDEKRSDVNAVIRDTSNISRAVEEHAIRTFEQASLLALSIRSRYEADDKLDLNALAQVDPRAMSIFQLLTIINEQGIVSGSSKTGFERVDLSGREHFKVHRDSTANDLFVSKPVLGKVSGKWSIQLTTPLRRADKSFAGVVVVSLDPFYLSSFYEDIDIGPHGTIILVGTDGVIRAQKGMTDATVGQPLDATLAGFLADPTLNNTTFQRTDASGETFLYSFNEVRGFPLSVIIRVSEEDALAGFHSRRKEYLAFAAGLSLMIYLLAAWMTRIVKNLRDTANRHRILFDKSPLGMIHFAPDGVVIDCNDKFALQMGSSKERIIGRDATGLVGMNLQDMLRQAISGIPSVLEDRYTSSPDNRTSYFHAMFNPVSDTGKPSEVIATVEDISARKNAELELMAAYAAIEERVAERTEELGRANRLLHSEIIERKLAHRELGQIIASISSILIGVNREGLVFRWNDAAEHAFGLASSAAVGRAFFSLPLPWDWSDIPEGVAKAEGELKATRLYNVWYEREDGQDGFFVLTIGPLRNESGGYDGFLFLADDISEVKNLEAQLANAGRLEAIGQLAAGIAHEINTPTQFVGDSVTFLRETFADLGRVIALGRTVAGRQGPLPEDYPRALETLLKDVEIDFLLDEIPRTFDRIQDGIERISTIVQAMRRFSHSGTHEKSSIDLREAIASTVTISRNEWKHMATVTTDFDPDLGEIICYPSEINQVLLNILVNAAHAMAEVVARTGEMGTIAISTRRDGEFAEIRIQDSGTGIPEDIRDKVFNMFFTTKEVGRGSGQGLAIARDIVVNKHGGSIDFVSEVGKGTTFIIRLPIGV